MHIENENQYKGKFIEEIIDIAKIVIANKLNVEQSRIGNLLGYIYIYNYHKDIKFHDEICSLLKSKRLTIPEGDYSFVIRISPTIRVSKSGIRAIQNTLFYQATQLKRSGIATEFYKNLEAYAKTSLNCLYIIGNNCTIDGSQSFFVNRTSRVPIHEFSDRDVINDFNMQDYDQGWTIKKL